MQPIHSNLPALSDGKFRAADHSSGMTPGPGVRTRHSFFNYSRSHLEK
jgi:hypothetical protein